MLLRETRLKTSKLSFLSAGLRRVAMNAQSGRLTRLARSGWALPSTIKNGQKAASVAC